MLLPISAWPYLNRRYGLSEKVSDLRESDADDFLRLVGLKKVDKKADAISGVAMLLGGLAVGAFLGILFAPKSGRELRRSFRGGGNGIHARESSQVGSPLA